MGAYAKSEVQYVSDVLSQPRKRSAPLESLRVDGRRPLEFREIHVGLGVLTGASWVGSSRIRLGTNYGPGGTGAMEITAGVKASVEPGDPLIALEFELAPLAREHAPEAFEAQLAFLFAPLLEPARLDPAFLEELVVVPERYAWTLTVHVTIASLAGGNAIDAVFAAVRAALASVRLPRTEASGSRGNGEGQSDAMDVDVGAGVAGAAAAREEQGMLGLLRGTTKPTKGRRVNVEYDLVQSSDPKHLERGLGHWQTLPVVLTLNLVNQRPVLDATPLEEAAAPVRLVTGWKGTEIVRFSMLGHGELEIARVAALLHEAEPWGLDLTNSLNEAISRQLE